MRATVGLVEAIGIRELRQHASRYLARVEAGEELGVTNKGRLVARLIPVQAAERSREALIEAAHEKRAKAFHDKCETSGVSEADHVTY
ncbi:type II toxin-antitoxin system prevent-host-death family antitoxin, partial [Mycobacterium tuberculosis]